MDMLQPVLTNLEGGKDGQLVGQNDRGYAGMKQTVSVIGNNEVKGVYFHLFFEPVVFMADGSENFRQLCCHFEGQLPVLIAVSNAVASEG